ncbi:MAG: PHP domain-containing protein [Dehalococcoidia bacterium]|nr:MAG: PHP domain-containing protein [Dehalococcoidia bacterium]
MTDGEKPNDPADEKTVKADFHIHTPESKCYGDPHATYEQLVDAAIAAGLQAMAVTDHNTTLGIDPMRKLAYDTELAIFPGIEISTKAGHVLAIFDRITPVAELDDLLDYVGASHLARGDGTIPVSDPMDEVFRKIDERGGIAIAAHIERWPTGFLHTKESRRIKQRIHSSPYLTALEITQPQNRDLWNKGQMRGFPTRHACIQGSDAHALEEIGRRPVFLQLPSLNLQGLRTAFNDYEDRIRFPEDIQHDS